LNMLLVGVLTLLLAVGVRQMMRTGQGAVWGPRLLGLFGVAYIIGGVLRADPVVGFPPGTTPEMVQNTWQGGSDRRRLRHRRQTQRPGLPRDALDLGHSAGRTPVPT
jgi:hypothetical protein